MALNRGRNSGVTGVLDIPGYTAKFPIKIFKYSIRQGGQTRPRRGRGGGVYRTVRWMLSSGTGSAMGVLPLAEAPAPGAWKGQTGTITIQIDTGKTVAQSVIITQHEIDFDEKRDDQAKTYLTWEGVADPIYTGWTTQATATDPSKADQAQWEGSSKTIDPDGIQTSAIRHIDIWGTLTDSDSAEQTKLLAVISAAATPLTTPHNAKLRSSTFSRDAIDGGTITETWALTTVAEDIENQSTVTSDDNSNLYDSATIGRVQASSTPSAPSVPAGLKLVHVDTVELNDSRFFHKWHYRRRDNEDDVEMGGTSRSIDDSNLADYVVLVEVQANVTSIPPATPAGLVIRDTRVTQIHGATSAEKWRHEFHYGRRTHAQDITFPGTVTNDDQSDLGDTATITIVDDSTPTPPATPSGYKLVEISSHQETDAGLYRWTYQYARRTNQEAIEFDGTPYYTDASSLSDSITITKVKASATLDAPSTPDGFVLVDYRIIQVHAASTGEKWIHAYHYGRITNLKQQEFSGTTVELNATQGLGYRSSIRVINTSDAGAATAPADPATDWGIVGKLVKSHSVPLTTSQGSYTGYWQHSYFYGPNDDNDAIVNQGKYQIDPSAIGTAQVFFEVGTSDTFPGDDPTPSDTNLKLIAKSRRRIQVSPERWEFEFHFGRNTREDELELYHRSVDPDDFGETERIPILHTSRTSSPGTPSQIGTSSNLIKTVVEDVCVANSSFTGLYLWTFHFGPTTDKQALEIEGQIDRDASTNAWGGQDTQVKTGTSSTPESDPSTRITGMVVVRRISIRVQHTPEKWKHVYVFDWLTPEEKAEYHGTSATADILGGRAINSTITDETLIKTCVEADDVDSLLVTEVATLNSASIPWFKATVRKLTKLVYELTIQRPGDDKKVREVGFRCNRESRNLDPTGAYLKVQMVYSDDATSLYRFKIGTWSIDVQRGTVILRRYFKVSTANTNRFETHVSSRNNASHLGYAAGTLHFQGVNQEFSWGEESGSRWIACDIVYEVVRVYWLGSMVDADYEAPLVPVGEYVITDSPVSVGGAFLAATVQSGWIAETKTNADYSGHLA